MVKKDRKVVNLSQGKERTKFATKGTKKINKDMEIEQYIIANVFALKVNSLMILTKDMES